MVAGLDKAPSITVIIPTHNRPGMLERALNSVTSQTTQPFEVVVVDDASSPEHAERVSVVVREQEGHVRLIRREAEDTPHGPDFARNTGILNARGRYVTFLDDDDFWIDRQHLETASQCLQERPDVDYFLASQQAVRDDAVIVPEWMPELGRRARGRAEVIEGVFEVSRRDLLWAGGIGFGHVNISVIRRDLIASVGGFWGGAGYEGDLNFFLRVVDRAEVFMHRPSVVSVNTVRASSDVSGVSSIDRDSKTLLRMAHCQHALLHCSSPEVRRYTQALLSGCLKTLARRHWDVGDARNAALFAKQAVAAQWSLRWGLIAGLTRVAAVFRSSSQDRWHAP